MSESLFNLKHFILINLLVDSHKINSQRCGLFIFFSVRTIDDQCTTIGLDSFTDCLNQQHSNLVTSRRRNVRSTTDINNSEMYTASQQALNQASALSQWKRIMLLVNIQIYRTHFTIN